MSVKNLALVVADIGGYTRFIRVHKTALLHAQEIVSQLLEAIVERAEFPLTLNKFEGDAVFLYADMGAAPAAAARDVIEQVAAFFGAFRAKCEELARDRANCPCDACQHIRELTLKAVLHHGPVAIRRIRQFEELTGEDVIVVHRLLKNSVHAPEYLLMSASYHRLAGELAGYRSERSSERYEDLGDIDTVVLTAIEPPSPRA